MGRLTTVDTEKLFATGLDLTPYENLEWRDLYLAVMKGVFVRHGISAEEHELIVPNQGITTNITNHHSKEKAGKFDNWGREVKVHTALIPGRYGYMEGTFGPSAVAIASTRENDVDVALKVHACQENDELSLSAVVSFTDPKTHKKVQRDKTSIRESGESRRLNRAQKRTIGVVVAGLGRLTAAAVA